MRDCFDTDPDELTVYFGPSAKVCCYQISEGFLENLDNCPFSHDIILKKDGSLYLDLPKLVHYQLLDLGVLREEIKTDYNGCTICDLRFHSYRRSASDAGRQATIISLK